MQELLEPIWEFYPPSPAAGSPFNTGNETFGLSPTYKRHAALVGDVLFQAPRRHFLRETPKDFGEPSWNFLYTEPKDGADARLGGELDGSASFRTSRLLIIPLPPVTQSNTAQTS